MESRAEFPVDKISTRGMRHSSSEMFRSSRPPLHRPSQYFTRRLAGANLFKIPSPFRDMLNFLAAGQFEM